MIMTQHHLLCIKIAVISLTLTLASCSNGGNSDPTPPPPTTSTPLPLKSGVLIHAPLELTQSPIGFYGGGIVDGRLITYSATEPSEGMTMLTTGPDTTSYLALSPDNITEGEYAPIAGRSVYIRDKQLFSSNENGDTKLSQNDTVQKYWISADETKIIYVANEISKRVDAREFVKRNELYVVDIDGSERIKISNEQFGNILYERTKFSGPPHRVRPQFVPDMSRIIFVVVNENSMQTELHSVLIDGTDHNVLNDTLVAGAYVGTDSFDSEARKNSFAFAVASDSSRVIYAITTPNNVDTDSVELFSIAPDGVGGSALISGEAVADGPVNSGSYEFSSMITSDSMYVIFLATTINVDTGSTLELFRVPLTGGIRTPLTSGMRVQPRVPPIINADTVIFAAEGGVYSVSIDGGQPTLANQGFDHAVSEMRLSADTTSVIYNISPIGEIFITKLDASSTLNLSGTIVEGGRVLQYMEDAASASLIFRAYAENTSDLAIYIVNLNGSSRQRITPDPNHDSPQATLVFGVADDNVYFGYDRDYNNVKELYKYNQSSGQTINISADWPKFVTEDITYLSLSPDGSTQSMVSNTASSSVSSLISTLILSTNDSTCRFSLPVGSIVEYGAANYIMGADNALYYTLRGEPSDLLYRTSSTCNTTQLNADIADINSIRLKVSPNNTSVAIATSDGLFAVDTDGNNIRKIGADVQNSNNGSYAFSPDSSRLIYWGYDENSNVVELYSTTLQDLASQKVNRALTGIVDNPGPFTPQISPDSQWIVYHAEQDNTYMELYRSAIDGSNNMKLSGTLFNAEVEIGNYAETLRITPDSSNVLYLVNDSTANTVDLYVVPIAGGADPKKLNGMLSSGGEVDSYTLRQYLISSDSSYVVYSATESNTSISELYAVNIDGTGGQKLNDILPSLSEVVSFNIDEFSDKVVYTQQNQENMEMYSVKRDGTRRVLLSNTSSRDRALLTGDGRVVFQADINGTNGIFVMSVTGGEISTVLAIPSDRKVYGFELSPTGKTIFVRGDMRQYGIIEVFQYDI